MPARLLLLLSLRTVGAVRSYNFPALVVTGILDTVLSYNIKVTDEKLLRYHIT